MLSALGVSVYLSYPSAASDDKRKEVARLPCPSNPKQLRSALGQLNFQRAYIPKYALMIKPLNTAINGTSAQLRTPEIQAAWARLMEAVAAQLALEHLDYTAQTRVRVDLIRQGVGGALFNVWRVDGQRSECLVAACSHTFTEVETNWAMIEQESFAMIYARLDLLSAYWQFPLAPRVQHLST